MKTTKLTMETLDDRRMLSVTPLSITAAVPEFEAVTVRRWEKLSVPMTEGTGISTELKSAIDQIDHTASELKYNFGGIDSSSIQQTEQGGGTFATQVWVGDVPTGTEGNYTFAYVLNRGRAN